MCKVYKGNKIAIVIEYFGYIIFFSLVTVLIKFILNDMNTLNGFIYLFIGIIIMGYFQYKQFRHELVIIEDEAITLTHLTGERIKVEWKYIYKISYFPVVRYLHFQFDDKTGTTVGPTLNNYKMAWRDIVEQARISNPNIIISKRLIRKLQKYNLLDTRFTDK